MSQELKVFEIKLAQQGEREWVCAYTNLNAVQTYLWITGVNIMDFHKEDEVIEVPKEKWPEMTIRNSDHDPGDPESKETETFEEYMKRATGPDIIAGTMYE